ncbi:hypothetical protein ACFL4O_01915 [bacterium]
MMYLKKIKKYFIIISFLFISSQLTAQNWVQGEIIVKFKSFDTQTEVENEPSIADLNSQFSVYEIRYLSDKTFKIKFPANNSVHEAAYEYTRNRHVEYAQPNFIYSTSPSGSEYKVISSFELTQRGINKILRMLYYESKIQKDFIVNYEGLDYGFSLSKPPYFIMDNDTVEVNMEFDTVFGIFKTHVKTKGSIKVVGKPSNNNNADKIIATIDIELVEWQGDVPEQYKIAIQSALNEIFPQEYPICTGELFKSDETFELSHLDIKMYAPILSWSISGGILRISLSVGIDAEKPWFQAQLSDNNIYLKSNIQAEVKEIRVYIGGIEFLCMTPNVNTVKNEILLINVGDLDLSIGAYYNIIALFKTEHTFYVRKFSLYKREIDPAQWHLAVSVIN